MRLAAAFAALWLLWSAPAAADCTIEDIGATKLTADAPVAITSVSVRQLPKGGRYCLVAVRVGENVNIHAGLPMDGRWNGDLQAIGRGGYGGRLDPPVAAVARGYLGVSTDTGHPLAAREPADPPEGDWRETSGAFALSAPGVPNRALREDFAFRSAHLMAVIARQLALAFYGKAVDHSYWFGCSTQGSHGLRAVQEHPEDYDGVLAGDPALDFAQVMAFQLWPQVVMKDRLGGPMFPTKLDLATARANATCADLIDPRKCRYRAAKDRGIVRPACATGDGTCLSPAEAGVIDEIWRGPLDGEGKLLWPGVIRGAPLGLLAGPRPFPYALVQPRYWVFDDPAWDWRSVTVENFPDFFARSIAAVNPLMAVDPAKLAPFFARGGRIILYHGFNDAGILPHGTIAFHDRLKPAMRANIRVYMFRGVGHCGGGDAPQPPIDTLLDSLVAWVEQHRPPKGLVTEDGHPLCAWPALPRHTRRATGFRCR